jgi:hypothetical protein
MCKYGTAGPNSETVVSWSVIYDLFIEILEEIALLFASIFSQLRLPA